MFLLKNINIGIVDALIFSLVAIVIVFAILILIVLAVNLLAKVKFKENKKEENVSAQPVQNTVKKLSVEDIKDEDMMLAALVATAEFVEETKEKDARLVSIKQIG